MAIKVMCAYVVTTFGSRSRVHARTSEVLLQSRTHENRTHTVARVIARLLLRTIKIHARNMHASTA
jgi:hypothetical protein